jgi:hypothetical protein
MVSMSRSFSCSGFIVRTCANLHNFRPAGKPCRVLRFLPMSTATYEDLRAFWLQEADDPAIRARDEALFQWLLEQRPERRKRIEEDGKVEGKLEGKLEEARKAVRDVLRARRLALGADEEARIAACTALETLERWLEQALR